MINRWYTTTLDTSDILLVTAVHAWVMWCFIRDHKETKDMFMALSNQREVFLECFNQKASELESTKSLLAAKCTNGHPFQPFIRKIITSIFNAFSKNLAKEGNSVIHAERKRKKAISKANEEKVTSDERKIRKLTSGGVFLEEKAPTSTDCGKCKFCLDKPKFGGSNTIRRKCMNKI